MIHQYSQMKNNQFDSQVKKLSLSGFRTIAFGYREVAEPEVTELLKCSRDVFLNDIRILGLVTFLNLLKEDT